MKATVNSPIRAGVIAFVIFALSGVASAQNSRLRIDNLTALEGRADKIVDVTLDESLFRMAAKFIASAKSKSPDAAKVQELISGMKGIYVKSFEFEQEGQYSAADVESIRSQLKAPGWSRMVGVRSKKEGENAEVYMMVEADKIQGLAILIANPKELTIINIIGTIDPERISELSDSLDIPRVELKREKQP
jgi:Zn-dependent alcohol dehydrogenase